MKYIKRYEGLFSNFFKKSKGIIETDLKKRKIISFLDNLKIKNYTINDDYSIDVDGDVSLSCLMDKNGSVITKIPFKFGKVTGLFDCSFNRLTNLENSPNWVGGNFKCNSQYDDSLISLLGGPKWVGGRYDCDENINIRTLDGCPEVVGHSFNFADTSVYSFDFLPNSFRNLGFESTPLGSLIRFINEDLDIYNFTDTSFIDAFQSYRIVTDNDNGYKSNLHWDRLGYFIENQNFDVTYYSNDYSDLHHCSQYWEVSSEYNIVDSEF